ncbi:MAG: lactonase family protein, partial [Gemmataceae bacterium]|nr:lactonase family protein [Gemmataceae bacterium]
MQLSQWVRGRRFGGLALLACALACAATAGAGADDDREWRGDWNAVFTLTNDPDGNELAVFRLDAKGLMSKPVFVHTCGDGTGGGLGNQGALALSPDGDFLYAVNPGSNSISVFRLTRNGPQVIQVIDSGGKRPISLAVRSNLLYVLNAGGSAGDADSVAGFEVRRNGRLRPLAGSQKPLSAKDVGPAQIAFSPSGDALVVTEKTTDTLTALALNRDGVPVDAAFAKSAGRTPFGFAFSRGGFLVVSEAFGGAANGSAVSSNAFDEDEGEFAPITKSAPTTQTAA